jgi:hypothetical protein
MSDPHGIVRIYRKGGSIMAEQFIDTIAEHITGAMQQEIGEELFDQWSYNHLEEGEEYAENQFMQYASDDLKKQYNDFYGYVEGDDYYLC